MEDNYKPSKEFSDQAWSEMKALLDKKMPEKGAILLAPDQGKRNSFLLLLPLLLILSIIALFFYYQSSHGLSADLNSSENNTTELALIQIESGADLTTTKPEILIAKAEVSIEQKTSISNQISTLTIISEEKVKSKNNIASSRSFNDVLLSETNENSTTNLIASQKEEFAQVVIYEKEIPDNEDKEVFTPFILDSEKFYDVKNEDLKEDNKDENPPVALITPIDVQSMKLLTILEEVKSVDEFVDLKKLKNRLPLFAYVGARNYDFSSNINFTAGLETVFRKQYKKLGLRTGLNYAERSTTYLTREQTIADVNFAGLEDSELELSGPTSPNGVFYIERAQLNANPIKYHFLEIPVFLDFKLSNKWSLHTGISAKAILFSSSQNFGLLNEFGQRNQDTALVSPINNPNADVSISFFEPQKFNFGASLGVNFMATQRLGLQARFSQNLRDIYPELNGNQRSNSVAFGVNWRLK
jgi:hypothetical protein